MKKNVWENFFGGFGFKFGHSGFFQGPGNYRIYEKGGWYEKLKAFLFSSKETLKKYFNILKGLIEDGDCSRLNPFEDFKYEVSDDGRDFVKDGENSGIY